MATTTFDVIDRPLFVRPSMELRSREFPGECVTIRKEDLRSRSAEDILQEIVTRRTRTSCPVIWAPSATTLEALRRAIEEARAMVAAAPAPG